MKNDFEIKIKKNIKEILEIFFKLEEKKIDPLIKKIRNELKKNLFIEQEQDENIIVLNDNVFDFVKNKLNDVIKYYESFINILLKKIYQSSLMETKALLENLNFESKSMIDYKTINTLILNSKNDLQNIKKFYDFVFDNLKKVKAIQNLDQQTKIDSIILKNLFNFQSVTKTEQELKDFFIETFGNKIKIKNRYYDTKTYAKIVANARIRQASSYGIIDQARNYDVYFFRISIHNTPCPICKKFEGNIYSTKKNDKYNFLEQIPPYHPFCKHTIIPYVKY